MDVIVLIGRVLSWRSFSARGAAHLTQTRDMAGYAASEGIPNAPQLVQVSGLQQLVGGLMVLLGIWMDLGPLILAAFLLAAALLIHAFCKPDDPEQINVRVRAAPYQSTGGRVASRRRFARAVPRIMVYWSVRTALPPERSDACPASSSHASGRPASISPPVHGDHRRRQRVD